jgi:hypothetical protein
MFCCKCGAETHPCDRYCHNCGDTLPQDIEVTSEKRSVQPKVGNKNQRCHKCGSPERLYSWDFGLGKAISSKRAWGETALSAAFSAVTVPLTGYGVLRLPGKRTKFSVVRLSLVLCDSCLRNREGYTCHPMWSEAQRLGFTEFFCAGDLANLEPVRKG